MNVMGIADKISAFMKTWGSIPLVPLPAIMVVCASVRRPGMSPMLISSRIISRQSEFDGRIGVNIDGSPNKMNHLIRIMVEEVIKGIKMEGKVTIGVPPGGITTVGTGENGGGPMVVTSNNVTATSFTGVLE